MKKTSRAFVSSIVAALAMAGAALAKDAPAPPDLTKGETTGVDRAGTYNLGATGLRGWIYLKPATHFDGLQGRTTAASRQILVTHVGKNSPADGVMEVNDVILGAGGKLFADDARKSIARAIQEAEKEANKGILKLTRWRPIDSASASAKASADKQGKTGKTEEVQLKLRVMGTYSDTAPYNCPKSKQIFDEACKVLEKEPLKEDWCGAVSGLALMATGKAEYLPRVREFARKIGPTTLKLELKDGMVIWDWGYRNIFLCEYYLLTGDKEVLHAINEYTVTLAKGQSMYGTFGHGISRLTDDGKLHGSIPPYGPVNMAGLPANLAIVLGKKCGVRDPEVDPAIERASKFFGYFVDKGAIPYGEHEPWPFHENNGKNSLSALLFAIQGSRIKETQFFAKMAVAGYRSRECGHTGQGFSYLWGALGANVGGPAAAAAFFKEASWHLDLVRRCDGSFTYDGGEQYGPGRTDDNTYYGKSSYDGLSPTASYVLTYSMPLKKLYITGRDASQANWLSKKEVADAIASGRFDTDRKQKSVQELVAAFGDWSPIVRGWAAEELAGRPEAKATVPQLITMAEGSDVHKRQCAAEALGHIKSPEAMPMLVRLLDNQDRWVRVKAANALKMMGDAARPAVPGMLKAAAQTAEPLEPVAWVDPIQLGQGQLAAALFQGPLRKSIKEIDPNMLYTAIRAVLKNPDGRARGWLSDTFKLLSLEDVLALGPDILAAIKKPAPANTMFGDVIREAGLNALAKYRFREAMTLCIETMEIESWGKRRRITSNLKILKSYGGAAKEVLPLLDKFEKDLRQHREAKALAPQIELLREVRSAIETATEQPAPRSLTPARPRG
jgi:hypothetical protein